jgi:hypothetical protein
VVIALAFANRRFSTNDSLLAGKGLNLLAGDRSIIGK